MYVPTPREGDLHLIFLINTTDREKTERINAALPLLLRAAVRAAAVTEVAGDPALSVRLRLLTFGERVSWRIGSPDEGVDLRELVLSPLPTEHGAPDHTRAIREVTDALCAKHFGRPQAPIAVIMITDGEGIDGYEDYLEAVDALSVRLPDRARRTSAQSRVFRIALTPDELPAPPLSDFASVDLLGARANQKSVASLSSPDVLQHFLENLYQCKMAKPTARIHSFLEFEESDPSLTSPLQVILMIAASPSGEFSGGLDRINRAVLHVWSELLRYDNRLNAAVALRVLDVFREEWLVGDCEYAVPVAEVVWKPLKCGRPLGRSALRAMRQAEDALAAELLSPDGPPPLLLLLTDAPKLFGGENADWLMPLCSLRDTVEDATHGLRTVRVLLSDTDAPATASAGDSTCLMETFATRTPHGGALVPLHAGLAAEEIDTVLARAFALLSSYFSFSSIRRTREHPIPSPLRPRAFEERETAASREPLSPPPVPVGEFPLPEEPELLPTLWDGEDDDWAF